MSKLEVFFITGLQVNVFTQVNKKVNDVKARGVFITGLQVNVLDLNNENVNDVSSQCPFITGCYTGNCP